MAGDIPVDWPLVSVAEIAADEPNAVVGGPFGSNLVSNDYVNTGVPVIRGQNMTSRFVGGDFVYVSHEKADSLSANLSRSDDVVFTQRGTLGQVAVVPRSAYLRYLISQSQMKLTVDHRKTDPLFVYYAFSSPETKNYIRRNATQSGVPHINLGTLRDLRLVLPPLKEQHAIAEILGSLDDKIELNRRMNQTLEAMARAIFKAWFVDFEPVKAKAVGAASFRGMPQDIFDQLPDQFTETVLGSIPKGWKVIPFSTLVKLIGGGTPKRKTAEYWGGNIPWFSVRDAPAEHDVWVIDTEECITAAGIENSSAKVMREGTTIISARGTVGRLALTAIPMAMNQSCYGIQGADGVGDFFVYFTLQHAVVELQQRTHGSVFDTITRKTFDVFNRVRPQPELLTAFEDVLAPYLLTMRSNLFENKFLGDIRDALLPKLLSGEIRVRRVEGVADGK